MIGLVSGSLQRFETPLKIWIWFLTSLMIWESTKIWKKKRLMSEKEQLEGLC